MSEPLTAEQERANRDALHPNLPPHLSNRPFAPHTEHVDTPPLSAQQVEAERLAKEVSEKDAAIAAAREEFVKDVQAANDKRNAVLAQFPDTSLAGITATAWNNTKDASDPLFADCILSHREKLATHAESVQRTGVPAENPSVFEIEVGRLLKELKVATEKSKGLRPMFSTHQPVATAEPFSPVVRPATAAEAEAEQRRAAALKS